MGRGVLILTNALGSANRHTSLANGCGLFVTLGRRHVKQKTIFAFSFVETGSRIFDVFMVSNTDYYFANTQPKTCHRVFSTQGIRHWCILSGAELTPRESLAIK